jgi:hypothetical protein
MVDVLPFRRKRVLHGRDGRASLFSNSYHSEGATHLLRFCYRFLLFSESVVVRDAAVFDRSREIAHEQE